MNNLSIFAGGLGTRLNGTEDKPKPLVSIGGLTLIEIIISKFAELEYFDNFTILTCADGLLYSDIISNRLSYLPIDLLEEPVRSGRLGAVKYFFDQCSLENSYFCNADTVFESLADFRPVGIAHPYANTPVVYLANPDYSRIDYKSISVDSNPSPLQNSGLFYIDRSWFYRHYELCPSNDIDDILLNANPLGHIVLNTSVIDVGTPERLQLLRGMQS